MLQKQQNLDKISVEELEQILRIKRRKQRQERFIRLSARGVSPDAALLADENAHEITGRTGSAKIKTASQEPSLSSNYRSRNSQQFTAMPVPPSKGKKIRDFILLTVEIGALFGLVAILVVSYLNLKALNNEVAQAQNKNRLNQVISERLLPQTKVQEPQPSFAFDRLPGGHSSPTSPNGAIPDIPAHLQNWVQPPPAVPLPAQESAQATRIVIPKINVDAPIIEGVTWEDLKKGVGHLPGSAQPGERGNLYLAAHNDIFGEIFRYLEKLEPGDEYYIYAGEAKYTYVVREKRIIEPAEVSVMLPTTEPVATLQTCYPYLIDTHRLVVISDLLD